MPGAVAADDADPLAVHDLEVDAGEHRVLAEGDADLAEREHALPAAGRRAELERDLAALEDRPVDRVHPVDLPLLVVRLANVSLVGNPGGPELEAGDRRLEPLDLLLLGHERLLLALQLELALERVGRVVAGPEPDPALIERCDLVDDLVEQVAVVRDRDDRAVEAPREQLHPGATLVVEVGLGLVEEQDVGLLLEAGGERDELALATREAVGRQGQLVLREPELEQGGPRSSRGARAAGSLEALECLLLAREHPRHPIEVGDHLRAAELRREPGQLPLELDEIGACVEHRLERRPVVTGGMLVEICDADAPATRHLAAVGSLEPGQDLQQVDLPPPFGPTTPIRAAGSIARSAPSRMRREPNDFVIARPARSVTTRGTRSPAGTPDGGCRDRVDAGKLPCHAGNLPLSLKGARSRPIDTR